MPFEGESSWSQQWGQVISEWKPSEGLSPCLLMVYHLCLFFVHFLHFFAPFFYNTKSAHHTHTLITLKEPGCSVSCNGTEQFTMYLLPSTTSPLFYLYLNLSKQLLTFQTPWWFQPGLWRERGYYCDFRNLRLISSELTDPNGIGLAFMQGLGFSQPLSPLSCDFSTSPTPAKFSFCETTITSSICSSINTSPYWCSISLSFKSNSLAERVLLSSSSKATASSPVILHSFTAFHAISSFMCSSSRCTFHSHSASSFSTTFWRPGRSKAPHLSH